jgi:uncharacterized membrane protein
MTKKSYTNDIIVLLIAALPAVYLAYIYPSIPATVPTHFDLYGKADGFGSKKTLIFTTVLFWGLSWGLYLLMKFLPRIDPKKTVKTAPGTFKKIGFAVVLLMSALNWVMIFSSANTHFNSIRLLFPLIGLFFAYVGNLMHSLKPNYFVGIRVPWTLEDPDNWRATHQMGGKLWVVGGIAMSILSLVLPDGANIIAFISITLLLAIIPIIYSYRYFKKNKKTS